MGALKWFPVLEKTFFIFRFIAISIVFVTSVSYADDRMEKNDGFFPSFGSGPLEVRMYTEYFCGPCRDMKPHVDPILRELIEKKRIRLTFIDIPMPRSVPYIHYFLYAINENNAIEYAFKVRGLLFDLAGKGGNAEDIRQAFKEQDIGYAPYNLNTFLARLNVLLQADSVRRTPTAVICDGHTTNRYEGQANILAALEAINGDMPAQP